MTRLLRAMTLIVATLTVAPACAYEQPYQQGWGPAPTPVWYQRPAPPPRWGWQAPPARWAGPPPSRGWGWDGPRATRYEPRRHDNHHDRRRDDRRW
jgi:hypothetical protein